MPHSLQLITPVITQPVTDLYAASYMYFLKVIVNHSFTAMQRSFVVRTYLPSNKLIPKDIPDCFFALTCTL